MRIFGCGAEGVTHTVAHLSPVSLAEWGATVACTLLVLYLCFTNP